MHRLAPTVRLRALDGDDSFWAFDVATGDHYELNETGYSVLRGLESGTNATQIAASLAEEYDLPLPQATEDVNDAIAAFERDGLISREEE